MKTNFRIMDTFDNGIENWILECNFGDIAQKYSEYEYSNINEEIGVLGNLYLFPAPLYICVKLAPAIVDKKPIWIDAYSHRKAYPRYLWACCFRTLTLDQ